MIIGIMSDSHGDAEVTARAVELLERHGAEKLLHCGDICSEGVLDELAGHDCTFVWGNCDEPDEMLRGYVATLGLPWPEWPIRIEIDGKRLGLCHGHEHGFITARREAGLDYLFHGHTHSASDYRENGCRIINPGALHRADPLTVAILDLETDELTFFDAGTGEPIAKRGGVGQAMPDLA